MGKSMNIHYFDWVMFNSYVSHYQRVDEWWMVLKLDSAWYWCQGHGHFRHVRSYPIWDDPWLMFSSVEATHQSIDESSFSQRYLFLIRPCLLTKNSQLDSMFFFSNSPLIRATSLNCHQILTVEELFLLQSFPTMCWLPTIFSSSITSFYWLNPQ